MKSGAEPLKVCVVPFGCQMNRADAGAIMGLFESYGHSLTSVEEEADCIVYVTCTVRQHAENRAMSRLGRHTRRKRDGVELILILAGCAAEKEAENALKSLPGLDIVAGTRHFHLLPQLVEQIRRGSGPIVAVGLAGRPEIDSGLHWRTSHYQAFVTVMRGCDNFCSYCIVPYVRGREYSRLPAEILEDVKRLAGDGVVEITFLGQNVNSYGKGLSPSVRLSDILEAASAIEGIQRLRFVTSHPKDLTDDLIRALSLPKVCPYLHLPAQSGSNSILKAMNRGYTREHYLGLIEKARAEVPGIAVASDFIVGFPGEEEADYLLTRSLIEEVRYSQAFIFKYSARPGTAAAELADDVPLPDKKRRNNELLQLQKEISEADNAKWVGRTLAVLVEGVSPRNADKLIGRAPTDRIVILPGDITFAGRIVNVKITSSTALALYGEVAE